MNYIALNEFKKAWIFRHSELPIPEQDKEQLKPMTNQRSAVLWDTFISKNVDHPDFFTEKDWPAQESSWIETDVWQNSWDSEAPELPTFISDQIKWEDNTTVYYCVERNTVIETQWGVFKRCWKNFLFMDDGCILIGKKRQEAIQFLSNGTAKLGNKPQ